MILLKILNKLKNIINCRKLFYFLLFNFVFIFIISGQDLNKPKNISVKIFIPNIVFPSVSPVNEAALIPNNTYYVDRLNPLASDSNSGTEASPWLTIKRGIDYATAGTKIIVKTGIYNENLTINNSGNSSKYIVIEASGTVQINKVTISGSYIAFKGFTILGDQSISKGISINGNYLYITENNISNFVNGIGIGIVSYVRPYIYNNIHIKNNYIYRCNKGIEIYGNNWIVEENKIERLYRGSSGTDADYFRFFGKNNIIRKNIMFGTIESEIGSSHVDLFQSFDNDNNYANDILIEKNIGLNFYHQGVMIDSSLTSHKNIIFYKNIFVDSDSFGYSIVGGYGIHVINNIIYNGNIHGIGFRGLYGISVIGTIKNNIIAYTNSSYWLEGSVTADTGYNCIYNCANLPSVNNSTDLINVNPLFNIGNKINLTLSDILGADGIPFTTDDGLNLNSSSPLIGAGDSGANIGAY